jgi:hypothetical protein
MVVTNDGNLHFLQYFIERFGYEEGKCDEPSPYSAHYEELNDNRYQHSHKIDELFV